MQFKFKIEGVNDFTSQLPALTALESVDLDVEELAISLDINEANSTFSQAVTEFGIESEIYDLGTEATAAAAKPKAGFFKRVKDQIVKMWKSLKAYVMKVCKWVKNKLSRNKIVDNAEKKLAIPGKVAEICDDIIKKEPNISNQELAEKAVPLIQKELGPIRGGGLEATDRNGEIGTMAFVNNSVAHDVRDEINALVDDYITKVLKQKVTWKPRVQIIIPFFKVNDEAIARMNEAEKYLVKYLHSDNVKADSIQKFLTRTSNSSKLSAGAMLNLIYSMQAGARIESEGRIKTDQINTLEASKVIEAAQNAVNNSDNCWLYSVYIGFPEGKERTYTANYFQTTKLYAHLKKMLQLMLKTTEFIEAKEKEDAGIDLEKELDKMAAAAEATNEVISREDIMRLKDQIILPYKRLAQSFTKLIASHKIKKAVDSLEIDNLRSYPEPY